MSKILIAEDEETNREVAEVILRNQGFEVLVATNGEEAVELARTHRPTLTVMDILMPLCDGLAATRKLKAHELTRDIPVLAVTARSSNSDRRAAMDAGCDGFLAKPYRNRALIEAVRQFLPTAAS